MTIYRSKETILAVQYLGDPIPDVTCHGRDGEVAIHGCDSSRKLHAHVHTTATGGMTVLQKGDWIFPVYGGPFAVASDARFRSHWEVVDEPPALVHETKHYQDGTEASGPGPLPDVSPNGAPAIVADNAAEPAQVVPIDKWPAMTHDEPEPFPLRD